MILLITPSPGAQECAAVLGEAAGEPAEAADTLRRASTLLRAREYSAVVVDERLREGDPDGVDLLLQHAETAVPVYVNLAISGTERVIRELRLALRRQQRERLVARRAAEAALRSELKDTVTALLLCCQLAACDNSLPASAQARMNSINDLAMQIRSRLEIT